VTCVKVKDAFPFALGGETLFNYSIRNEIGCIFVFKEQELVFFVWFEV